MRNAIVVKEKEDIFQELKNFDPTKTIILEENIKQKHFQGNFQPALITSYHPNRISIEVNLKNPGFLFLGDIWFPGWKAFDNGKEKKVMKANYAFRSVFLEPGEHRVEFVYDPLSYKIGKIISLLTLFLLLTYGFFAWKRKKELNF
ncbi:MAG: YfhO family protein [Candidatus Dadabacteria bacterium]|nr:YfhO family protein [Candidatus Dadabacteria bacterium]